uniref:Ig-like domain-containing protein n=1 Tax=Mola mola TaxID=94237 RepID=A0A3Q3XBL2_MOLML
MQKHIQSPPKVCGKMCYVLMKPSLNFLTVSLVCEPNGAQADEELVWLRNGALINLKEGNDKGHSSVCVTPVIHEDNGAIFTCSLSKNSSASASVTLNVTCNYLFVPLLPHGPNLFGSEEVTVEEEAVLLLQCDTLANPPVSSVSWTVNGSKVNLEESGMAETNDGFKSKLTANKVERRLHEGTFNCSAVSSMYGVHTKTFYVKTIKFPLMPMIAGLVVVGLTALLAVLARWQRIMRVTHETLGKKGKPNISKLHF